METMAVLPCFQWIDVEFEKNVRAPERMVRLELEQRP